MIFQDWPENYVSPFSILPLSPGRARGRAAIFDNALFLLQSRAGASPA